MLGYQIGITYDVTSNSGTRAVMTRYALNLPDALKRDAELLAKEQGISLNQFIPWSVAEKVGALLQSEGDDSNFPGVAYRRGASGVLSPVLCGMGIRVQTIVIASENMSSA
jgi:HicB-like protein involved in pilus formation